MPRPLNRWGSNRYRPATGSEAAAYRLPKQLESRLHLVPVIDPKSPLFRRSGGHLQSIENGSTIP
jgi:hypothetical protein